MPGIDDSPLVTVKAGSCSRQTPSYVSSSEDITARAQQSQGHVRNPINPFIRHLFHRVSILTRVGKAAPPPAPPKCTRGTEDLGQLLPTYKARTTDCSRSLPRPSSLGEPDAVCHGALAGVASGQGNFESRLLEARSKRHPASRSQVIKTLFCKQSYFPTPLTQRSLTLVTIHRKAKKESQTRRFPRLLPRYCCRHRLSAK